MTNPILLILYAAFLWWFSTGLILLLSRLPRSSFPWSLAVGTVIFVLALVGLWWSRNNVTPAGALCAFSCGLIVWGWQELTFYLGALTGPRKHACPPGCSGWRHFGHALQVSLYHELAILITTALLVALFWDAPNRLGLATFLLIMVMHQSARLNVFLGVRNVSAEWVPEHLPFMKSFLNTDRPINLLWPFSQGASTALLAMLVALCFYAPAGSYDQAAFILCSTLLALGILEHWVLVLPLPLTKLWSWWDRPSKLGEPPLTIHSGVAHRPIDKIKPGIHRFGAASAPLLSRRLP